jgi:transposase InsO family protein
MALYIAHSRKQLVINIAILQKEVEILKRKNHKKRLRIKYSDRVILSILNMIGYIKEQIVIVKPETVLKWQRELIKRFWTFRRSKLRGRPPVSNAIKQLILEMKNDNLNWGARKIQGELLKLNIHLNEKTIRNILNDYRRKGMIKKSLSWKQFLTVHIHSIYARDFFTIDTILNQRFYIHFIVYHKTREIVSFAITRNPCKEFIRQQLIEFEQTLNGLAYMICDNVGQFIQDYLSYGIKEIRTSVKAPNMNAIAERVIGSIRREALDYFILLIEKQILNILQEYIAYYNFKRPHQGLGQRIPSGYLPQAHGRIQKKPVLDGFYYHYERSAA